MPDIIRNNAYRVLGLDGNANQRDIMKRYREITSRLKIDDHPQYALDLNLPDSFRTESSVDDALKKLQNHRSNLTEYFFWFSISDTVDEEAFEHLRHGDAASYGRAAQIWKDYSSTENSSGLSYKKNLAILYCLSMFSEENDAILRESVSIWKEIVNADIFWRSFEKKYVMGNSSEMHEDTINNLRKNITANISDIYYDLYEHHNNTKYVKEFQDTFGTFGQKTEKHLLKPIHQSVYESIEKLNRVGEKSDSDLEEANSANAKCDNCKKVSERLLKSHFDYIDGSILCQECRKTVGKEWQKKVNSQETVKGSSKKLRQIERTIEKLELNLKQLRDLGLHNTDQSIAIRDHAAEAIRAASVTMHNQAHMREKSLELFDLAKKISTTTGTRERLESDAKVIAENIARDKQNTFVTEWGILRKKKLTVTETFIEYQNSKIYYNNVDAILYFGSGTDYFFSIGTTNDEIHLKFDYSRWAALVNRVVPLVEPHLLRNLLEMIFEKNQDVHIKNIRFDKTGYHRSSTFRKNESVLWNELSYLPRLDAGKCLLFKNKNNNAKRFATVSLHEPNAIIIPALAQACYHEFYRRQN